MADMDSSGGFPDNLNPGGQGCPIARYSEKSCDLKTLLDLSTLIGSSLDIHTVLANAMNVTQSALSAEASTVFELDRHIGELYFRLALGDAAEKVREVRLKTGEGFAGWVVRTKEPLIIDDAYKDPRFCNSVDIATGFKTRSVLCVPMICKGELTGVLEVLNKKDDSGFNENDLELLTIIAGGVAIAIEHAKLYSRLKDNFTLTVQELKMTQDKLSQSERVAALGRLSQGVAHEVRNPVMVIGGFARRLKAQFAENKAIRDMVDIILSETERLERIVIEVENLTKLPSPELKLLKVTEVVEESLSGLLNQLESHGIQVMREFSPQIPAIEADKDLLEMALEKVMLNAIEAMPSGGTLGLSIASQPDYLVICITDTGVGIRPEHLPNVFDPFFTSKTSGAGLGLTTVYRIISDHRGEVEIESTPGEVTKVRILLPHR